MGSREEFEKAVKFVDEHKIRPVVHSVLASLEDAEEGFQLMKSGGQFGKVGGGSLSSVFECELMLADLQIVINVEREKGKL